jgi:hypothetical protein
MVVRRLRFGLAKHVMAKSGLEVYDLGDDSLAPLSSVVFRNVSEMFLRSRCFFAHACDTMEDLNISPDTCKKLVPNLNKKTEYVLHVNNLQYYLEKGLICTNEQKYTTFCPNLGGGRHAS